MKLPKNSIITSEKLTDYLLVHKKRNDKSKWLAYAGYSLENWRLLEDNLRSQILSKEAEFLEEIEYGRTYMIKGKLIGPNGTALNVCSIWMIEKGSGNCKFITMYPDKA